MRAGRKPAGARAELRHASRAAFRRLPSHVTLRVRPGVPSLRSVPIVREIARTFRIGRARPGFRLVHYSLQGNHAHLIVEAVDAAALGRGMMALAARLARAVNRIAKRTGPVLSDRYHAHLLRTARECRNALRYVLLNARRHARPRLFRAVVRRLEAENPRDRARWNYAAGRLPGRPRADVDPRRRLAPLRPHRPRRRTGVSARLAARLPSVTHAAHAHGRNLGRDAAPSGFTPARGPLHVEAIYNDVELPAPRHTDARRPYRSASACVSAIARSRVMSGRISPTCFSFMRRKIVRTVGSSRRSRIGAAASGFMVP